MTRKQTTTRRLAILYARFSPRPRAKECESVESQLTELNAYCAAHEYEVAGEFSDKALSGGDDWTDRPGMLDAASACKRGSVFMVRAFDRLFRDARMARNFIFMIESKGASILSITEEAASLNTPQARFMRNVLLEVAELHRIINNMRTKARMLHHQVNGRRMSKTLPYGKRIDPSDGARLVKDFDEIATIAMIVQFYREGLSLRTIAEELDRRGIPSRGQKWRHGLVSTILRREGIIDFPS